MADWFAADWPAPPGVHAGTSLRRGGSSSGPYAALNLGGHVGDAPDAVAGNRRRLVTAARLPAEPQWLAQVHGTRVVQLPASEPVPEADAAWTAAPGIVCAVLTADCLPVVLARSDGSAVAIAHAGWRGLCGGVVAAAASALGNDTDLRAWLGPAISQEAFEVGGEVRDAFLRRNAAAEAHFRANANGRWQADLYGLARLELASAGVTDVHGGGRCTWGEAAAFFSYRRDGACGRMATWVWRAADP